MIRRWSHSPSFVPFSIQRLLLKLSIKYQKISENPTDSAELKQKMKFGNNTSRMLVEANEQESLVQQQQHQQQDASATIIRERYHLEKTILTLKGSLGRIGKRIKRENTKLMDQASTLVCEVNEMKRDHRGSLDHVESISIELKRVNRSMRDSKVQEFLKPHALTNLEELPAESNMLEHVDFTREEL